MVTSHERGQEKVCTIKIGAERRQHRRHEFEHRGVVVERYEGNRRAGGAPFGSLVDISAGGIRVRTPKDANLRADAQIRVRLSLPEYAGIAPFVDHEQLAPRRDWVGWMTVRRIDRNDDGSCEIAGPLEDMEEIDRGMLGLYLSTQPMAA